ncbi:uncharacterized protein LOC123667070 [Melitaea cinxia]|uniref:uncharacterized protein LOC123663471 n=2 Tax=Melitaea cinxia TaxID=113334 RepID=UPI001E274BDE|nr:uncharacterized protein LOC123663471 [Melitaea cinxia]XP_045457021.1 uncharacterized protein LOC123667070 [Melitaea cinxia]
MVFPHTSRGKRILALIDKHNNSPIEEVTPNDTSDEKANQTSYEVKSLPNESSSSCSSSPNSNSSADSDSSDETFIEDSDDSVKDPMYIPPEQLFQQKRAEFIETIECSTPLPSTSTADRLITLSEPPPLPYQRSPESLVEQRNKNYTATNFDSVNPLSSTSIENSIKASSPASPKAKKGRKRKRNEENWKRNVNKMLRNTGKAYKSASNKIKEERKIKEPCGDKCRLQCKSKLSEDERMLLFKNYWALGDNKKQWEYISKSMSIITPKYRYIREGGIRKPRNKNHAFHFKLPDKSVRVCKIFFKNTLGINDRPIRTVLEKEDQVANCLLADDKRGKHDKHPRVDEAIKNGIREYIDAIPKIESHYTRSNTSRVFIDGSKNIADIHKDYVAIQQKKNLPFGNYVLFYKIFTQEFNISFFSPKKDMCDVCAAFENSDNKENLKEEHDKHLKEKELCRAEKAKDKLNENIVTAVYDLQAVFQCPKGDVSVFYYKCKLNVFNFTICDLKTNKVECFVWDESSANRGVNDLGTCVYKYLEQISLLNSDKSLDIVFYSDNCAGQQKNKTIIAIYLFALQKFPNLQTITHKYLIKGHTQNEGDAAHSLIERQVKKLLKAGPMYTPEAFIGAIKMARKNPEPFHVNEMCTEDFVDWKDACTQMGVNLTKDEEGNSVKIGNIKILKIEKDNPRILFYKNSYGEEEFKKAEIIRKKKRIDVNVKKAYDCKPGISDRKKADLLDLLNKNLIPQFYARFYNSL